MGHIDAIPGCCISKPREELSLEAPDWWSNDEEGCEQLAELVAAILKEEPISGALTFMNEVRNFQFLVDWASSSFESFKFLIWDRETELEEYAKIYGICSSEAAEIIECLWENTQNAILSRHHKLAALLESSVDASSTPNLIQRNDDFQRYPLKLLLCLLDGTSPRQMVGVLDEAILICQSSATIPFRAELLRVIDLLLGYMAVIEKIMALRQNGLYGSFSHDRPNFPVISGETWSAIVGGFERGSFRYVIKALDVLVESYLENSTFREFSLETSGDFLKLCKILFFVTYADFRDISKMFGLFMDQFIRYYRKIECRSEPRGIPYEETVNVRQDLSESWDSLLFRVDEMVRKIESLAA